MTLAPGSVIGPTIGQRAAEEEGWMWLKVGVAHTGNHFREFTCDAAITPSPFTSRPSWLAA